MVETASLSSAQWAFWDTWMQAQRLLAKEVDRILQRDFGISKAEFGILVKLYAAPDGRLRVTDLANSLDWEKGRVAHQLTRMETRGLLERSESGAAGRRTGIALTPSGKKVAERAIRGHAANIRRLAFDRLSPEQAAAIDTWSKDLIDHLTQASSKPSAPDES
jgi:DNA-binding MarR family transcriptional regulator